jgi:hypothetical protein
MDSRPFDSSQLSSYFRELAEKSNSITSSSTLPDEFLRACGPWVSITAAVAKASFALAGVNAAGPIADLVIALSGVSDTQTELLKSIKADTLLLRQEPFQTAITLMDEAKRVGPHDERWVQFLEQARDNLYRAKSLAASPAEQAVVYFGLACAFLTLDQSTDARHWIGESVQSERKVLDAFLRKPIGVVDVRRGEKEKLGILGGVGVGIGVAGLAIGKPFSRASFAALRVGAEIANKQAASTERRVRDFQRFLHFANSVELCSAVMSGRPEVKVLDLKPSSPKYLLSEETFTLPHVRKLPNTWKPDYGSWINF